MSELTFEEEVKRERGRQIEKWGVQSHSEHEWLAILVEEVGEVAETVVKGNYRDMYDEIVQIAAVAKAWHENFFHWVETEDDKKAIVNAGEEN